MAESSGPCGARADDVVLATDICLVLLLLLWQPCGGQIWHVHGAAAVVLWSLCAAGWLLAIASTFAVDHLELTGLRQAGWAAPPSPPPPPSCTSEASTPSCDTR